MTHETNIFINRDQRACVRKSRWIPILLWRKCVHFVTAFAIWRLWKFLSNDSGAHWRFWLLSVIKLHFPSDAREAVPLCHSQTWAKWLLAGPQSQEEFMWYTGDVLLTEKLCCSSGWLSMVLSWHWGRCPGDKSSTPHIAMARACTLQDK